MTDNSLTPRGDEFGLAKASADSSQITDQEPSGFFKQLLGFWVTFVTMFKNPILFNIQKLKSQRLRDFMVAINLIVTQMDLKNVSAANSVLGHVLLMPSW